MKYKLEITAGKGYLIAKVESSNKIVFDQIVKLLMKEGLIEDQDSGGKD